MSLTVYDKAKWHTGATRASADIPPEAGATHIALILRWCMENGLCSKKLLADHGKTIADICLGKDDCRAFFMRELDGVFTSAELNTKGRAFLNAYYSSGRTRFAREYGTYLGDCAAFAAKRLGKNHDNVYLLLENSEASYRQIKKLCNRRHAEFIAMKAAGKNTPRKA
ncbi:hypothetical protein LJC19_07185 [Oxalobacter sp. OttesenSCG-928-P03]|nr:hypothetical protein [Oxalobacter sp. OttesenSCG-928-P03]